MTTVLQRLSRRHLRWRITRALAVAILLAGIAHAAHYHKGLAHFGSLDVHCLLCQYAGGTAAPPQLPDFVPEHGPCRWDYLPPASTVCPHSIYTAPYDARGPPAV